jgi:hypothetical protein
MKRSINQAIDRRPGPAMRYRKLTRSGVSTDTIVSIRFKTSPPPRSRIDL